MDRNDAALSELGIKGTTLSSDFADFSQWNTADQSSTPPLETPRLSKPKIKTSRNPTTGSKLKKKRSIKKSSKKKSPADLDGSHEKFEDEPDSPVSRSKAKKKKSTKKKTTKDQKHDGKSRGNAIIDNALQEHMNKSQTHLQVEGSVSSLRDIQSDHDDSTLTDSVVFSDSSIQLNDSNASSMFLEDPYAADSSEDDVALLFLKSPELETNGGNNTKVGGIPTSVGLAAGSTGTPFIAAKTPSQASIDMARDTVPAANAPSNAMIPAIEDPTQENTASNMTSVYAEQEVIQNKPQQGAPLSFINSDELMPMSENVVIDATHATTQSNNIGTDVVTGASYSRSSKQKNASKSKPIQQVHGSSKYMRNDKNGFITEAEFASYYPACCSRCSCCVNKAIKTRSFAHVYENRLEVNNPVGMYCCCSTEQCIRDRVHVYFFDKPPFRAGMSPWPCCCCLSAKCGPPVMAATRPWCVCFCLEFCDCTPCFGEIIFSSPCNCHDCKECCCCGSLCWWRYACPFIRGLKKADVFLAQLHTALEEYKKTEFLKKRLDGNEMVKMYGADKRQVIANEMERG